MSLDLVTGIISGTPTASAAFATYTITASNSCGSSTIGLDITVTTPITSVTYSTNPAIYCANVAIPSNNPTTAGGTANSYSVTPALPAGLALNPVTGVITGTPTATNGVAAANYTITALNSCSSVTVDVNITISPATPATPGPLQVLPPNVPVTRARYTVLEAPCPMLLLIHGMYLGWTITAGAGSTSITVTTGGVGQNGNITVTADNSCGQSAQSILAVTVAAAPTAIAGGPDVVCESGTPADIILNGASISGGAPGAWSLGIGGGTLSSTASTNTPATVSYSPAANFSGSVTIILTPDVAPGCPATAGATRTITVNPSAKLVPGGEDNICQSPTPGAYILVGASFSGGASTAAWTITSGGGGLSTSAQTGSPATVTYTPAANFTGIALLALTSNDPDGAGPCPAATVTRVVNINAAPVITSLTATQMSICPPATSSTLTVTAPVVGATDIITSENFNGIPTFIVAGSSVGLNAGSIWTKRANNYNAPYLGTFTDIDGTPFMLTSLAAILVGATNSTLTSPTLSTMNYTSLTLTFQHTYKPGPNSPVGNVEVSTNGGASWTAVKSYGATAVGAMNGFVNETIILPVAYLNQPNFKFRFNYSATIPFFSAATSWWAVDNVVLTGTPNTYKYSWTAVPAGASAGLPVGAGTPSSIGNNPIIVTPTVTTDYTVTETDFSVCSTTRTITITVAGTSGAPVSATALPTTICTGASSILTLNGGGGGGPTEIVHWYSGSCGGASVGIGNNLSVSPLVTTTYFGRYESSACAGFSTICKSVTITVAASGTWIGITTDWNDGQNWCTGVPPTTLDNVTIPVTPNNPVVSTAIATAHNITINLGATLTVTGNTLQISGNVANNGTFTATNGTIEFNGLAGQTTATTAFATNTIKNLVISNTAGVSLGAPLNLTNSLTYGIANGILVTNGNLTLKSTVTGTAWVGDMTNHTIIGDATVERYITSGINHAKSWQLLAIPTMGPTPATGQSIKNAWEEGAVTANGNPNPGFGTMLTSDVAGAASQPLPGFDAFTTLGPSIKVYNNVTNAYDGPANTGIAIYNKKGYFVLVRGDRSRITSAAPANPTILRTKGRLLTPANGPFFATVGGAQFESVGNPYASAIDLNTLAYGAGINTTVIVWDPTIGGTYGLGAFQTLFRNGGHYENVLSSTAYGPAGTTNNYIQSGQAFIIQGTGAGGTLTFAESNKAPGSNPLLLRPQGIMAEQSQLRTNLYAINGDGSSFLADGTLIQYDKAYSNIIDKMDARKMTNTAENLSIKSGANDLVVERRQPLVQSDTVFYDLTGVRVQPYRFEFVANGIQGSGLEGFLEDTYLHTKTPLNTEGTTQADFSVTNIEGSYAPGRFRIVFAPSVSLPETFTSVKAYREDKNINVEWRVENERNIKQYEVEKSTNGVGFTTITIKAATGNNGSSAIYVTTDSKPLEGYNYYRIKSMDINGKIAYTGVVKVLMGTIKRDITISPNPIIDGMIHLQLLNQPEGKYGIRLLNKLGQVIISSQVNHPGGSSTELIKWDYKLSHGIYQLEVTRPDGDVKNINVLY